MQRRDGVESALDALVRSGEFRFGPLSMRGVDNSPIVERFGPEMSAQETCLIHRDVPDGDACLDLLHRRISDGIRDRAGLPVVRFADGEYAFYDGSLKCNGLYRQAESPEAIRASLPMHVTDLRFTASAGLLAPLVFPGNISRGKRKFPSFWKFTGDDSAVRFLDFLSRNGIRLGQANYIPFYAVYAYLTSRRFAREVDGKRICILNSDIDRKACEQWFGRNSSRPEISEVPIPASFVATRWASMEEEILARVPRDSHLCLVGAGVGALPVCAAVSRRLSIPSVDAGHVLNMMNDMEKKSAGPRLYTIHR